MPPTSFLSPYHFAMTEEEESAMQRLEQQLLLEQRQGEDEGLAFSTVAEALDQAEKVQSTFILDVTAR
jgi:hypothetical protein